MGEIFTTLQLLPSSLYAHLFTAVCAHETTEFKVLFEMYICFITMCTGLLRLIYRWDVVSVMFLQKSCLILYIFLLIIIHDVLYSFHTHCHVIYIYIFLTLNFFSNNSTPCLYSFYIRCQRHTDKHADHYQQTG